MKTRFALVLEDDSTCRTLLAEVLAERNIGTIAHADPTSYLATHRPEDCLTRCPCLDFILTDNQMPNMSGLDFLEQRKEAGCKFHSDRVALISGNLSNEDILRAQRLGCRVFNKPVAIDEIYRWLDEYAVFH